MTKEQLIKSAKEKGFKSKLTSHNRLYLQDKFNDLGYYLWLCELQKWLRDEHKVWVLLFNGDLDWAFQLFDLSKFDEHYNRPLLLNGTAGHKSHDECLGIGCFETLKLIK